MELYTAYAVYTYMRLNACRLHVTSLEETDEGRARLVSRSSVCLVVGAWCRFEEASFMTIRRLQCQ